MELIEREAEFSALRHHLRLAETDRGRLVFVGGEAGVGKTALVRCFALEATARARVFHVSCDALSTPGPLGPLFDLAPRLGPEVGRLLAAGAPRDKLFRAVLADLDRPEVTVLVAEDAHWADEATVDLLRFFGRRVVDRPLLVLVTYRDDDLDPAHPLRRVLGDLATEAGVHRQTVRPLSAAAVRQLAAGSGVDADVLYRLTGGNPFFVTEVLAAGGQGIPPTVRDAILARAGRLSPQARHALDIASLLGSPLESGLLLRVAGPVHDAVDECVAAGLLCSAGDELAFRHELARGAIQEAIAPVHRRALHARVLAALAEAPEARHDLARLAHHAEAAGDRAAVLAYAVAAAEVAAALHAHRQAAEQYARALRFADGLPPERRAALLAARSYECYLTDQLPDAIGACQAALGIWRQVGDRRNEGDAQRKLSRLFWFAGRNEEAEQAARAALEILEPLPPGPPLAMAYSNRAQLRLLAWDLDDAIAWSERSTALAERLGETETLVHALNNVGMAVLAAGDEQGQEAVERSLRLALAAGLEEHAARAFGNLGLSYVVRYRLADADRYLRDGISYCAANDLDHQRLYMLAWHALSLVYQGRWSEAGDAAGEVVRQPRVSPISRIMALVALGRVGARRGDPEAAGVLDEALALASRTGELQRLGPVRVARAEAAWLAGDRDRVVAEARSTFERLVSHKHRWLIGELAFWLWRAAELTAAPPGAFEPFALQIAGDWAGAAAGWDAAGCPYEAALARLDGDEASVRRSLVALERLDAKPAATMARRRLRALGARAVPRGPRRSTQANPAGLTRREVEVLVCLAEGLRNADIGERLFLTPKTVDHHVSAILSKLGVGSRVEAARAAARLGIVKDGEPTAET